jgi:hypothetical protein
MRTLQEWLGHRDNTTTQSYADDCPNPAERDVVASAFARGTNPGTPGVGEEPATSGPSRGPGTTRGTKFDRDTRRPPHFASGSAMTCCRVSAAA